MYEVRRREQSDNNKYYTKCDDRSKHNNTSTLGKETLILLLETICLHDSRHKESNTQIINDNGYQTINQNHTEECDNPFYIPLRYYNSVWGIFFRECRVHLTKTKTNRFKNLEVAISCVCKDARLNLGIAFLGICIKCLQLMLAVIVVLYIFLIRIIALL